MRSTSSTLAVSMMIGVRVLGRAQPAADRQAVFARQHQVEHDQVDGLAGEHAVQRLGVFGQQHVEAFLRQVAAQQVADACVVVDNHDAVGPRVRCLGHCGLQICNNGIVQALLEGCFGAIDHLLQVFLPASLRCRVNA